MANRTISLSGNVFAANGTTTIPTSPVTGTTYRNSTLTATQIKNGWPYNTIVDSANQNQFEYLASSVLAEVESYGICRYTTLIDYHVSALVIGSDGTVYQCIQINGPSTGTQDPTTATAYWEAYNPGTSITWATSSEVLAGTDTEKAIDPLSLKTAFAVSASTNGYSKLPGGLIIQWGTATVTANSSTAVTLPVTFTSACLNASATVSGLYTNLSEGVAARIDSTSQITVSNSNAASHSIFWIAIGS